MSCDIFLCYMLNPVIQIKMTTIAPPGHVHEDLVQHFSSTITMEKRERRDSGFGMEMMERREEVVLQWRRGRGACDSDLGLDERAGAL